MTLITHLLSPPLSFYIDQLYYVDGPMPYQREKILPAAWLDLKINLGGAIKVYTQDQSEPSLICTDSWSVGLWNTYHAVEWPADLRFYGVFFKPGGAYPFLQLIIMWSRSICSGESSRLNSANGYTPHPPHRQGLTSWNSSCLCGCVRYLIASKWCSTRWRRSHGITATCRFER